MMLNSSAPPPRPHPYFIFFKITLMENPGVSTILGLKACDIKLGVNCILGCRVTVSGVVFILTFFWISEYFLTSKSFFSDKITKDTEIMLNQNLSAFIWWKENENCIFHSKAMSIFVKPPPGETRVCQRPSKIGLSQSWRRGQLTSSCKYELEMGDD